MTEEDTAADPADVDADTDPDWPLEESSSAQSGPTDTVPEEMDPVDEPLGDALDRVRASEHSSAEQSSDRTDQPASGEFTGEPGDHSGPMGDLAAEVQQRREASVDSSEHFDQEGVETVDPDVVWEQLEEDDPIEASTETAQDRTEEVIDAGTFCERCEYFSEPPEVHCTHEGTEIAELVDVRKFRVLDCPKVEQEKQLEDL